jgi:acetylornithine deacetylase/succinyl-diaminopimelate desuccinylase-like protein
LVKLGDYDTKPMLIPSTREFFDTLGKTSTPPMSTYFQNLVHSDNPELVKQADHEISKDPLLHAIMRNTIAPVLLNGGFRGNVIPGSAEATINFRIIPGTDVNELIKEIKDVIDDPRVEITMATRGMGGNTASLMEKLRNTKPSPQDTELYSVLAAEARRIYSAPVTPYLFQAGTDSFAWRSKGIPVYGIYPYPIDAEDLSRMHGNDERVSVESLRTGTELIYKTLVKIAAKN